MVRLYEASSHSSLALISSLATPSGFYAALYTSCIVSLASHPPQRNAWWGRSLPPGWDGSSQLGPPRHLLVKEAERAPLLRFERDNQRSALPFPGALSLRRSDVCPLAWKAISQFLLRNLISAESHFFQFSLFECLKELVPNGTSPGQSGRCRHLPCPPEERDLGPPKGKCR